MLCSVWVTCDWTESSVRVSREIHAWEGWIEKHLIKLTMWHFWSRKEHLRCVNRHLKCKCCEPLRPIPNQPRIAPTAAKSSQMHARPHWTYLKKKQLSVHWAMLYLLTMGTRWNQSSLSCFRFCFFLLQIKYEATVTVYHSPVHICWRKTPWARNGKRWSFHPGPRWTPAGEQECMRGRKTQRKTEKRG